MPKALVRENFIVGDILLSSEVNNLSINSNAILETIVAGETITTGNPCFIANGLTYFEEIISQYSSASAGNAIYAATNLEGQTFRTKPSPYGTVVLTEIQAYIAKTGTPSGNVTINIYAVDAAHKPTGSSLGSASITTASVSSLAYYTFTFNVALSAGTEYAMVMSVPSGTGANYVSWYFESGGIGTNIIDGFVIGSTTSGSTWNTGGDKDRWVKIRYSYVFGTAGRLYRSYAGDKNRSYFDCFAQESKTVGQNCVCQFGDLSEDFTGLTAGARYFLEDYHALVASITTGSSDDPIYTATWIAQTFTTLADQVAITKVVLDLSRTNNVTGDVSISIRATSAGLPTGSDLGVRVYPDSVMFPHGVYKTLEVEFDTPIAVSPSTVYAVVVRCAGGSAGNNINWKSDGANPYAGGQKTTSNNSGSSWTAVSGSDMKMLVYGYSNKILTAPVSWQVLLGEALTATSLFIEKEDHAIHKISVNEANQNGASSSCQKTYDVPKKTKQIVLNMSYVDNGDANADMAGQIILTKGEIMVGYMKQNYGAAVGQNMLLTATWSGDSLTLNAYRNSGTATFIGDIIFKGR